MHFSKGNQLWKLRNKHGRDKLFSSPELMWEAACEYFQWCIDNPLMESVLAKYKDHSEIQEVPRMRAFTIIGITHYLGCNKDYFTDFIDNINKKPKEQWTEEDIDFSRVAMRIREVIYNQKFEGAAAGFLNATIISRDLGLADKSEVDQNIKLGMDYEDEYVD